MSAVISTSWVVERRIFGLRGTSIARIQRAFLVTGVYEYVHDSPRYATKVKRTYF